MIEAFGNFVVGGITSRRGHIPGFDCLQYVVINHGAVRISEVTARFTLDTLPGKQMSIDSDLNAGLIDESEARERRQKTWCRGRVLMARMDGASRFTQRDAIASILITTMNIVAGFLIGLFQNGMDLSRALSTYTVLTIGDGLATVIPALMVSVSGGLIVTRASSEERLGADVRRQVFSNPQPLMLAGGVFMALAAFPGLPNIPFLILGSGVGFAGFETSAEGRDGSNGSSGCDSSAGERESGIAASCGTACRGGRAGFGSNGRGWSKLAPSQAIAAIRRQMATDLGYMVPRCA